uniref:Peptide-methionine (R)-S-oxide reductase n=1 Tax=Parastrongyloides trichosuri TaxID=131310 RepID=A0A0N4ZZR3_PARTI
SDAVVRDRRFRLRPGGPVLRRIRGDDAGLRQRLHLHLRHPRRALSLVHRLDAGAGIRRRGLDRRGRLVRLCGVDPERLRYQRQSVSDNKLPRRRRTPVGHSADPVRRVGR